MAINRGAYRFFRSMGETATEAAAHARAEHWARCAGYLFDWQPDADPDFGDHGYWCPRSRYDAYRERSGHYFLGHEHCTEGVVMRDAHDHAVTSLWGVIDADARYSRVLEAELATEVFALHMAELRLEDAPRVD